MFSKNNWGGRGHRGATRVSILLWCHGHHVDLVGLKNMSAVGKSEEHTKRCVHRSRCIFFYMIATSLFGFFCVEKRSVPVIWFISSWKK